MPLTITPTEHLSDLAPGPYVDLLVSGINANLVPDPGVDVAATWTDIIAGTYPGISAPTTPAFWTRDTTIFNTTPASLKVLTTTTDASGKFYLTPWIPANAGMQIWVSAAARVTLTDSSRTPGLRVEVRDSVAAPLTSPGRISWATTVNAAFTVQSSTTLTLPTNTAEFRVFIDLEGTATNPMTVYFDNFNVVLQPNATTITVSRVWEGEETYIQGGYQTAILGPTMLFYDYAIPFTTDVIYKVVTQAGSVVKESKQSDIINLVVQGVWLSDAVSPELAMKITPVQQSFKRKVRVRPGGTVAGITRKRRQAIVGTRQEAQEIPLGILTYTEQERMDLETILNNADPIIMRCSSDHKGMPPLSYITFSSYEQEFVDAPSQDTVKFTMLVDFVAAPSYDILLPIRTYNDYLNEFTSYGDTTWPSYLSLLRGS